MSSHALRFRNIWLFSTRDVEDNQMFLNSKAWPFYSHTREFGAYHWRGDGVTARASISMAFSESAAASGTEGHPFPPVITVQLLYRQQQHYAFATFNLKDFLLFGNGEHPQLVQLEYFYKTLIESVLTNDNQLFLKITVCLSFPLPIPRPVCQ